MFTKQDILPLVIRAILAIAIVGIFNLFIWDVEYWLMTGIVAYVLSVVIYSAKKGK
jgi:hypothetical protein